jgi:hypothetical protein
MTDKDVIDHLENLTRMGSRYSYKRGNNKEMFCWRVTVQVDAASLMMTLYPLMHNRRRTKIRECLELWRSRPYPHQLPCPRNHDMKKFYTTNQGQRACRDCEKVYRETAKSNRMLYPS